MKQQDQQGRHQRAAADPGHPDQEADGETGYDKEGIDGREQGHIVVFCDLFFERNAIKHKVRPGTIAGHFARILS
ncbi:MAG TPA: hypothetical protein VLL04_08450, partial [Rhizomicrobium sp.]|nr:hypothetical protein [Rhizomicrobium sp.]